jgi:hypothetical protein
MCLALESNGIIAMLSIDDGPKAKLRKSIFLSHVCLFATCKIAFRLHVVMLYSSPVLASSCNRCACVEQSLWQFVFGFVDECGFSVISNDLFPLNVVASSSHPFRCDQDVVPVSGLLFLRVENCF